MAYYSGFNTDNIDEFIKIKDTNNLIKNNNYLVRYSTLGKPRLYHIARYREFKEDPSAANGKPLYWFDSLYVKRPSEKHWLRTGDTRPHVAFDNGELYIDEELINTDHEPLSIMDEGFDFSIFELGEYGNRITDTIGPEDILPLIMQSKSFSKTNSRMRSASVNIRHGGKRKSRKSYKKNIRKSKKA